MADTLEFKIRFNPSEATDGLNQINKAFGSFQETVKGRAKKIEEYVNGSLGGGKKAEKAAFKDVTDELKKNLDERLRLNKGNLKAQAQEYQNYTKQVESINAQHRARMKAQNEQSATGRMKNRFAEGFQSGGGGVLGLMNGITKAAGPAGMAIAAVGGAVLKAGEFALDAAKKYQEFQDRTTKIRTLLTDTQATGLPDAMNQLREVAVKTGAPLESLQNSVYTILSSVPALANNLGAAAAVAEKSAKASVSLGMSTEQATQAFTSLGNAAGLNLASMKDQDFIMDKLAVTMNVGVMSGEQLASNIAKTAPLMSALSENGYEAVDAIGTMSATLTQNGVSMEEAQTMIKAFGGELMNTATRTKLIKAGLEGVDASTGKVKDWTVVMQSLSKDTSKYVGLLGSQEAKMAALTFAKDGAKAFTENATAVAGAAGTAERMFGIMGESGAQASARLDAQWEDLKLTVGEGSSKLVAGIKGAAADALGWIADMMQSASSKFDESMAKAKEFGAIRDSLGTASVGVEAAVASGDTGAMEAAGKVVTDQLGEIAKVSGFAATEIQKIMNDQSRTLADKLTEVNGLLKATTEEARKLAEVNAFEAQAQSAQKMIEKLDEGVGWWGRLAMSIGAIDAEETENIQFTNVVNNAKNLQGIYDGLRERLKGLEQGSAEYQETFNAITGIAGKLNESTAKQADLQKAVSTQVADTIAAMQAADPDAEIDKQTIVGAILADKNNTLVENVEYQNMLNSLVDDSISKSEAEAAAKAQTAAATEAAAKAQAEGSAVTSTAAELTAQQAAAAKDLGVTEEENLRRKLSALEATKAQNNAIIAELEAQIDAINLAIASEENRARMIAEVAKAQENLNKLKADEKTAAETGQTTVTASAGPTITAESSIAELEAFRDKLGESANKLTEQNWAIDKAIAGVHNDIDSRQEERKMINEQVKTGKSANQITKERSEAEKKAKEATKEREKVEKEAAKAEEKRQQEADKRQQEWDERRQRNEEARMERNQRIADAFATREREREEAASAAQRARNEAFAAAYQQALEGSLSAIKSLADEFAPRAQGDELARLRGRSLGAAAAPELTQLFDDLAKTFAEGAADAFLGFDKVMGGSAVALGVSDGGRFRGDEATSARMNELIRETSNQNREEFVRLAQGVRGAGGERESAAGMAAAASEVGVYLRALEKVREVTDQFKGAEADTIPGLMRDLADATRMASEGFEITRERAAAALEQARGIEKPSEAITESMRGLEDLIKAYDAARPGLVGLSATFRAASSALAGGTAEYESLRDDLKSFAEEERENAEQTAQERVFQEYFANSRIIGLRQAQTAALIAEQEKALNAAKTPAEAAASRVALDQSLASAKELDETAAALKEKFGIELPEAIKEDTNKAIEQAAEAMNKIFDAVEGVVTPAVSRLGDTLTAIWDEGKDKNKAWGEFAAATIADVGQQAANGLEAATGLPFGRMFGALKGLGEALFGLFRKIADHNDENLQKMKAQTAELERQNDLYERRIQSLDRELKLQERINGIFKARNDTADEQAAKSFERFAAIGTELPGLLSNGGIGGQNQEFTPEGMARTAFFAEGQLAGLQRELEAAQAAVDADENNATAKARVDFLNQQIASLQQALPLMDEWLALYEQQDDLERQRVSDRISELDHRKNMGEFEGREAAFLDEKIALQRELLATARRHYDEGLITQQELWALEEQVYATEREILNLKEQGNALDEEELRLLNEKISALNRQRQELILKSRDGALTDKEKDKIKLLEEKIIAEMTAGGASPEAIQAALAAFANSTPGYAVGSPYIPADQFARVHEGERILSKTENAALIATLNQWAGIMAALSSQAGGGGALGMASVVINVYGNDNPAATARAVRAEFESLHTDAHRRSGTGGPR